MRITLIKSNTIDSRLRRTYSFRVISPCGHLQMKFDYYKEQSKASGQWVTEREWIARRDDNDIDDKEAMSKCNQSIVKEAKEALKQKIDNLMVGI